MVAVVGGRPLIHIQIQEEEEVEGLLNSSFWTRDVQGQLPLANLSRGLLAAFSSDHV